jgi:hypothetical protein
MAGKKTLTGLRSCACQASAAWRTALPMAPALELKDAEFCAAMQHRLGMSPLPRNTVGIRCTCAAVLSPSDNIRLVIRCEGIRRRGHIRMASWSQMGTPSSRSRLRPTAAWTSRPSAFLDSLARRRNRQGARLASLALWRLPSGA